MDLQANSVTNSGRKQVGPVGGLAVGAGAVGDGAEDGLGGSGAYAASMAFVCMMVAAQFCLLDVLA